MLLVTDLADEVEVSAGLYCIRPPACTAVVVVPRASQLPDAVRLRRDSDAFRAAAEKRIRRASLDTVLAKRRTR